MQKNALKQFCLYYYDICRKIFFASYFVTVLFFHNFGILLF